MSTIEMPRYIVNQLLELALNSPDSEICGLISSIDGHANRCYPTTNIATDQHQQFHCDPEQHIDAMRSMRERGESLFAIYHSHPNTPAIPSLADIEQLSYPQAIYLIISLQTTGTLQMRAFCSPNNSRSNSRNTAQNNNQNNTLQAVNVAITDTP
ncbi:MAG: M67 family metallopeptidase [Ectothiorhodospiraceae bacterium]|nr:M67 family metallopeptidase [Ectothiorhodospiraceae bacterium]